MEGPDDAALAVRQVLRSRTPLAWRNRELPDDLGLGAEGLGLDSVSIVELVLDCEEALAISIPAALFDGPVTIGRLIEYAVRAAAERAAT
jgi:acyl carrier protein